MTLDEMRTEVATRLNEDITALKYWTLQDIDNALNAGYENISDASEWYEVLLALPLSSRRGYYDLRGFPITVLSVRHAYNMQTQRWMTPTSVRDLDKVYRQWEHVQGASDRYFIRGLNLLGVWPRSPQDSGQIRLGVTSFPPRLVNTYDVPGFDSDFHWGLVDYAVYELKSDDREKDVALGFYAKYLETEMKLKERVRTRQSLDKLHSLGQP